MKEFNWEGFRRREFVVNCKTEEAAKEFVKEAHRHEINWFIGDENRTNWKDYRSNTYYARDLFLSYGNIDNCNETIIEWKNDDMKSFREVIRDIKEGEVWENENFEIIKVGNGIEINLKDEPCVAIQGVFLGDNRKFKLKQYFHKLLYKIHSRLDNRKFKLKQYPVTFEEVLNSDKRCRIEHEILNNWEDYVSFGWLMITLAKDLKENELKEVIKNGKWYLEP